MNYISYRKINTIGFDYFLESKVIVIVEVDIKIAITRGWGIERIQMRRDYSKFNVTNKRNKFWCS